METMQQAEMLTDSSELLQSRKDIYIETWTNNVPFSLYVDGFSAIGSSIGPRSCASSSLPGSRLSWRSLSNFSATISPNIPYSSNIVPNRDREAEAGAVSFEPIDPPKEPRARVQVVESKPFRHPFHFDSQNQILHSQFHIHLEILPFESQFQIL
jgi:hypothetical protein